MTVVGSLDGEPLFATQEEAVIFGELFRNCVGSHIHRVNGVVRYMACKTHAEAIKEEYIEDELGKKKKKRKKKYKYTEYASYINQQAVKNYTYDTCMRDMKRKYKDSKLALKVCNSIKNNR